MIRNLIRTVLRRDSGSGERLERDLADIERQAATAVRDMRGILYARAGSICADHGQVARALAYYGEAVDANLELGYFDVAAGLCRTMMKLSPTVVRARCTMAFLSLGKGLVYLPFSGLVEDARRQIGEYVHAAREAQRETLAIERLQLMAEVTDSREIRELIAEYLLDLGDPAGADRIYGLVYAERNDLLPPPTDQRERWADALRVSVVRNESPNDLPLLLEQQ